ncbi:hypothetical protein GCM10017557_39030 [Streptomyces aurantiacus]|uniref:HTH tetR-type domain-containing protein n=2 Tax=Streptomyces aurantiacus TaxID=47760 RepID=A0A7G1P5C4_9ACTN|nr:hypothetical protein GCM10017557_39030 [Streptomyces aurantiacus]
MNETRDRILDVALDVLGENPDAGMGDIASAAGVVRRTIYGHFPSRLDLVRTLTERAVTEMTAVLAEVNASGAEADAAWVAFIARVWPVAHRYRVLLALRRGEYGEAIHGLLGPVDELLADLVERGQDSDVFAQHLPAGILSQVAYGVVFAIADSDLSNGTDGVDGVDGTDGADGMDGTRGAGAATITSLLMLGVPEARAIALVGGGDQP